MSIVAGRGPKETPPTTCDGSSSYGGSAIGTGGPEVGWSNLAAIDARPHGISSSRPRPRRDLSPRNIHVATAAAPRPDGADGPWFRLAAIDARPHGISTSRPRRRRDPKALTAPVSTRAGEPVLRQRRDAAADRQVVERQGDLVPDPVRDVHARGATVPNSRVAERHRAAGDLRRASVSTEHPRRSRGVAERLHGTSTSQPRRRRVSPRNIRVAASPRPVFERSARRKDVAGPERVVGELEADAAVRAGPRGAIGGRALRAIPRRAVDVHALYEDVDARAPAGLAHESVDPHREAAVEVIR